MSCEREAFIHAPLGNRLGPSSEWPFPAVDVCSVQMNVAVRAGMEALVIVVHFLPQSSKPRKVHEPWRMMSESV